MGKRMGLWLVVLCLGLIIFPLSGAQAATLNVCKTGCEYSTIQSAIDAASGGDTVLVDDGVYTENINFNGLAITVQSVNGADYTTIDGNASGSVVTFSSSEGASSVLNGFKLTNGSGTFVKLDWLWGDYGGGIFCSNSSSPAITNCTISGNSASSGGGGIYCDWYSSPTITNCIISGNLARGNEIGLGGGILCVGGSPSITNCIISGNSGPYGGGIFCWESSAAITNCTISGNSAGSPWGGSGGGISCWFSSPTVVNSIFWGDSPDEIYFLGENSSIDITYSDIEGGDPDNPGSPWPGTGNIDADPQFGGDYHLTAGSPCIDRGTDDTVTYPNLPTDDIDGDVRPYDVLSVTNDPSAYDMGSDEYYVPGDVDGSGCLDIMDVGCAFYKYMNITPNCLEGEPCLPYFDVNNDGVCDIMDVGCMFYKYMNITPNCLDGIDTCPTP